MLEVRLLGNLEVRIDGEPVSLPSRPAQSLLAFLALHAGQPYRREHLAGLLWPESEESNARRYLSQSLWRLRKALGDDYFEADRLTITFQPKSGDHLDVLLLEAGENAPSEVLARSLEAYNGRLLPGFYEDWALAEADRLQRLFERQVQTLLDMQLSEGRFTDALEWSERWLQVGEKPEPAYRSQMRAYAGLGDQAGVAAAYQRCVEALESDLGVAPSPETQELYEQIRSGQLEQPVKKEANILDLDYPLPAFLDQDEPPETARPVFVAREHVLAGLETELEQAIAGQGRVVFILGEAGQGKTSLLEAFTRQVQREQPDIAIAAGICNAYAGGGDPYLPFREIFAMLTGDLESEWQMGLVSTPAARRLWNSLPETVEILLRRGPNLLDTLLSARQLLARAQAAAIDHPAVRRLGEVMQTKGSNSQDMRQDFVFEQAANVLMALAKKRPLLLILDDLHWADESTVNLLFHLGRRILNSPILIVGAYRPEDIRLNSGGVAHPMQGTVNELKRLFGNIELSLDEDSQAYHQEFASAYLDTEPNHLDEDFRLAFAHHTGSHPLFAVETLREMQANRDLVQDENGFWVAAPDLSWNHFSARVEGVIENRIARLSAEERQLLTVASVEGEVFSADVVARVVDRDVRAVVGAISGPIAAQHQLVLEQGRLTFAGDSSKKVSQYRFRHHLFQKYLYEQIGESVRAYLHEDVGDALEAIYGPENPEAAVQLARHFGQAGREKKELTYLRLAGEEAARKFASKEAIGYFSRALALVSPKDLETRWVLHAARERVYRHIDAHEAQDADLKAMAELGLALSDLEKQAETALRRAAYQGGVSNFDEASRQATRDAIELARQAGDIAREGRGYHQLTYAYRRQSDYVKAEAATKQALILVRKAGDRRTEAHVLLEHAVVVGLYGPDYLKLDAYTEQALDIAREIGDRIVEMNCLANLGISSYFKGNLEQAEDFIQASLSIAIEIGSRGAELVRYANLGGVAVQKANFDQASAYYQQVAAMARERNDEDGELVLSATEGLGRIALLIGNFSEAQDYYEQALLIAREIGERFLAALLVGELGVVAEAREQREQAMDYFEESLEMDLKIRSNYLEPLVLERMSDTLVGLGKPDQAEKKARAALALREQIIGAPLGVMKSLATLARALLSLDKISEAEKVVQRILDFLDEGGELTFAVRPVRIYLTCYQVLAASGDPARAQEMLAAAHRLLMERAVNITNKADRRSYLENIAWHREVVELWEGRKATEA